MTERAAASWAPLFERDATPEQTPLFEGVPPHLDVPLRQWQYEMLSSLPNIADRIGVLLRVDARTHTKPGQRITMAGILARYVDATTLLAAIDASLHLHPSLALARKHGFEDVPWHEQGAVESVAGHVLRLQHLLTDGGSAWRTSERWDRLERRVDETASAAASSAVNAASAAGRPNAAKDLADAWAAAYGIHPSPSEAYRLAIRAVEDVAVPLVIPKDRAATLGKVRAHLRDTAPRWELSMGSTAEPLVEMTNLLWSGQTDRHAGQADLARVDQPAAEAAVHLAATLVQWFAGGHVKFRDNPAGES